MFFRLLPGLRPTVSHVRPSGRRAAVSLVAAALFVSPSFMLRLVAAEGPPKPAPAKVDLYGDVIPAGAVLRLGTVRFRGGDMNSHVAFSRDGNTLLSTVENAVYFWETRSGKRLRQIELPESNIRALDLSPDGKTIAVAAFRFDEQHKDIFYSVLLLDFDSGQQRGKIEWIRKERPAQLRLPAAADAPCHASARACAATTASPPRTAGTRVCGLPATLRAPTRSADGGSRSGAWPPPTRAAVRVAAGPHSAAFDSDRSHDTAPSARRRVAGSDLLPPASPALPLAAPAGSPLFCDYRL